MCLCTHVFMHACMSHICICVLVCSKCMYEIKHNRYKITRFLSYHQVFRSKEGKCLKPFVCYNNKLLVHVNSVCTLNQNHVDDTKANVDIMTNEMWMDAATK